MIHTGVTSTGCRRAARRSRSFTPVDVAGTAGAWRVRRSLTVQGKHGRRGVPLEASDAGGRVAGQRFVFDLGLGFDLRTPREGGRFTPGRARRPLSTGFRSSTGVPSIASSGP